MNADPLFAAQAIFPGLPSHPSCHASTLLALPDGNLLVAFYAGSVEKAPDVAIFQSRYEAARCTWTSPRVVVDYPGKSLGNPVLYIDSTGVLWLFYLVMQGHKWHQCTIHYVQSADGGLTWSKALDFRQEPGWTIRNNLIVLDGGEILFPLADNVAGCSVFLSSTDGGQSWQTLGRITSQPRNEQPAVVQLANNSLLAHMRTAGEGGQCWQARSLDCGRTWTPAEPGPFPNPNSALAMIRLANGGLVQVYNHSHDRRFRTPLNVALSLDQGTSWPYSRPLETLIGPFTYRTDRLDNWDNIEFSYPAIVQDRDGLIHITYTYCRRTIKHAICNEAWLKLSGKQQIADSK
jgi:predicted neuraminidase